MDGSSFVRLKRHLIKLISFTSSTAFLALLLTHPAMGATRYDSDESAIPSYNEDPASLGAIQYQPGAPAPAVDVQSSPDVMGYDAIVNQLNRESMAPTSSLRSRNYYRSTSDQDPFENVLIHFGAGLTSVMQTVNVGAGQALYLNQRGVQAALGIDLFSANWMAEGTARSFGESEDQSIARATLSEFDLKILFKDRFSHRLGYKLGAGLSGRYMSIRFPGKLPVDYTTPASVATLGLDFFLNERISFGAELSTRNAIIGDTIDRSSYDATLRMDTHF